MLNIYGVNIEIIDIAALLWFGFLWISYSVFAENKEENNLVKIMHKYRLRWMKQMVRREDRLIDVRIISALMRTTIFFASTSILIIGGLVAVLGYGDKAIHIIADLPFGISANMHMWIIKTMLLLVIFVYSFFKFTWVIRQFNYSSVLVVATPYVDENDEKALEVVKTQARYAVRIATMLTNAGRHFNMGVRSYYFGLVALSWYISPVIFMLLSILVIAVLYRREFMSKTLILLE